MIDADKKTGIDLKSKSSFILNLIIWCALILFSTGCKDDSTSLPLAVTTLEVSDITSISAVSGGVLNTKGVKNVISRGICWSVLVNPTINNEKTVYQSDSDTLITHYKCSMTGLAYNTTYYVRAYATTSKESIYGNTLKFSTADNPIKTIPTSDIPAGTFLMGSASTETYRKYDETQHTVILSAFRMGKYEITNEQFATFLNAAGVGSNELYTSGNYPNMNMLYVFPILGIFPLNFNGSRWYPGLGYEKKPVSTVTWYGASEFARYVGGFLPSEAQWEYACRAGTTTKFNTGESLFPKQANFEGRVISSGNIDYSGLIGKVVPVGSYNPNSWGLYDMHGNVNEWCSDIYGIYNSEPQTNPIGAAFGEGRVVRGGSYESSDMQCRSAYRNVVIPTYCYTNLGFRVAFKP